MQKQKRLSRETVEKCVSVVEALESEVGKLIVGQGGIIKSLISGLLCNSHVLVEGIPGIAKTSTILSLSMAAGCKFSRVQFTVDLLPTDIIGLTSYDKRRGFYVVKGPIFTNFLLADEINRSPPKTQSAMLEAMQERQVTIGKRTYTLPSPFFVMATQNPVETEGTFPLPEAQLDRFLFKLFMTYPEMDEERILLDRNITIHDISEYGINPVATPKTITQMQEYVKLVYVDETVKNYIVRIVDATRNPSQYNVKLGKYIEWGVSPRASIGLYIASKANALINGRDFVTPQDVKDVAYDVLNHRILLNYEGQAENINTRDIVAEILKKVKTP